jgi:hypothetical protein
MRRSLLNDATPGAWLRQFGEFDFSAPNTIRVQSGSAVNGLFHAEAHYNRVLGADFAYSATITADWTQPDLGAHLQFRISDEGRYGVRLQAGTIALYRFMLEDRPCSDDPAVIAHCPLWPGSGDDPIERLLAPPGYFDPTLRTLRVTVVAEGSRFIVSFGTPSQDFGRREIEDIEHGIGIGRFGVYAIAATPSFDVRFSDVAATTDPTATSNFTLLYSTPGYDLDGTKRALVRTVNDIDAQDYDDANSTFTVTNALGKVKIRDRRFEVSGPSRHARRVARRFRRTLGFQFLAADFTDLREAGRYTLEARLVTSGGIRVLRSRPFEIIPRLVTERMLWPLSILNAKARRAAEEDFRRNWFIDSGHAAWSVGLDGAFVADRADDQSGAVLRRIFNTGNLPLSAVDFRFVARITIVAGCDAQLQFRITDDERWAVTLQAGDAGGCQHGAGPGAVRLHREGRAVPNEHHFQAVASHQMDSNPFKIGRAYDVEVRALGQHIEVMLDGVRVIDFFEAVNPRLGAFALKAWGSTVRFGHVKVWARNVGLSRPVPGVWIPFDRATNLSSQGFKITTPDFENNGVSPTTQDLRFPLAAQQHGFHDCNSFIGEVTSHSVFLSSLLDVWATRAHAATASQQEDLRHAILTAVLYLNELYEQGNRSGAFAHQEPGRAALGISNKVLTTQFAMYGLSSFAEKGGAVDKKLARDAFDLASMAWGWLDENGGREIVLDSIVAIRMARAAQREGMPADSWFDRAKSNAADVLTAFGQSGAMAKMMRPTLRSIPWFEGVYETFFRGSFELTKEQRTQLDNIAGQLVALANDTANGFCLIPQANDTRNPADPALPARNWDDLADLPLAVYPIPELSGGPPPTYPVGDWYISNHFATAAADCVYIGRLAGQRTLERLATGNLYWILGLNPGIPTTKVAPPAPTDGPWSAASFVYNGSGAFARSIEGNRTRTNAAKGWLADWEESASSRHREIWAIDLARNGFQSIVNGHVLRESQWHYWSVGAAGWVCAETFMLTDAGFLKAALALEDWHSGSTLVRATPYDVTKPHFFDTTHLDRASTPWRFDDPDRTPAALASRMVTDFAASKGFGAGRLTGHHIGERVGVLCLPAPGTTFIDVPDSEIAATLFPFDDINTAPWAQVARAATEIAAKRGAGAGFFTGHQVSGRHGWIGIDARLVEVFDIDDKTVAESVWAFTEINTVGWAQAARLATDICIQFGFAGGFFTGHQLPNKRQIAALRHT